MPTYTFENKKTGETYDDMMSISEKEAFEKSSYQTSYSTNKYSRWYCRHDLQDRWWLER